MPVVFTLVCIYCTTGVQEQTIKPINLRQIGFGSFGAYVGSLTDNMVSGKQFHTTYDFFSTIWFMPR